MTHTITVGTNPFGVAVTPDGSQVYVANSIDATVSVIDAATNTVTATITVGAFPVSVTPDGTTAFAAGPGPNVTVDNLVTDTVTKSIPITGSILPNLLAIVVAPAPK